jgi:hypothetical protein
VIKIRISSFTVKWGDKQLVLVSKPKKEDKKKKKEPDNGNPHQSNPTNNFL